MVWSAGPALLATVMVALSAQAGRTRLLSAPALVLCTDGMSIRACGARALVDRRASHGEVRILDPGDAFDLAI